MGCGGDNCVLEVLLGQVIDPLVEDGFWEGWWW